MFVFSGFLTMNLMTHRIKPEHLTSIKRLSLKYEDYQIQIILETMPALLTK